MSVFIGIAGTSGANQTNAASHVFRRDGTTWTDVLTVPAIFFGTYFSQDIGCILVNGLKVYVFAISSIDSSITLYVSLDDGNSWSSAIAQPPLTIPDCSIDSQGQLYAKRHNFDADDGIYRSIDDGTTWIKIQNFLTANPNFTSIVGLWTCINYTYWIELVDETSLITTLVRLDNNTLTTSTVSITDFDSGPDELAGVDGLDDNFVIIWTANDIDKGQSISNMATPIMFSSISNRRRDYIHPLSTSIFIARVFDNTTDDEFIYRSIDAGASWSLVATGEPAIGGSTTIYRKITHENANVYLAGEEGGVVVPTIFVSGDNGATWSVETFSNTLASITCVSRSTCSIVRRVHVPNATVVGAT